MGRANPSESGKKPSTSKSANSRESAAAKPAHKPLPLGSDARKNARVVFALAIVALSLWTAASFLSALIWATILAIALWPLYAAFAIRVMSGPSGWAAFVFTCFVAMILFTPMSLAIYQVAQQSGEIADWLKKARESGIEVPDWIARLPIAAEIAQQWWRANLSDPQAAAGWLKAISADSASDLFNNLGGQLLHRMFMLFFSLVALFILLSNGRSVASRSSVSLRSGTLRSSGRVSSRPVRLVRRSTGASSQTVIVRLFSSSRVRGSTKTSPPVAITRTWSSTSRATSRRSPSRKSCSP